MVTTPPQAAASAAPNSRVACSFPGLLSHHQVAVTSGDSILSEHPRGQSTDTSSLQAVRLSKLLATHKESVDIPGAWRFRCGSQRRYPCMRSDSCSLFVLITVYSALLLTMECK